MTTRPLDPLALLATRALHFDSGYVLAWEQEALAVRGLHGDEGVARQLCALKRDELSRGFTLAEAPAEAQKVLDALPAMAAGIVEPLRSAAGALLGALVVLSTEGRDVAPPDRIVVDALVRHASMVLELQGGTAVATVQQLGGMPCVLVVEDDRVWRRMLRAMLKPEFESDEAASMSEAVSAARGRVYDAVLLDLNLAERHTGVEVMHALWDMPHFSKVPVVACTSVTMPNDVQRYRAAGFSALLAKPFNRQHLHETLRTVIAEPAESVDLGTIPLPFALPDASTALAPVIRQVAALEGGDLREALVSAGRHEMVSAGVLRLANSLRPATRSPLRAFDRAVGEVGAEQVARLALVTALERLFEVRDGGVGQRVFGYLLRLSMASAVIARKIADHLHLDAHLSFAAALLHAVGRMALLYRYPDRYPVLWIEGGEASSAARSMASSLVEPPMGQELILFGVDHVQLGTQIAHAWQLPEAIVRSLQFYRYPDRMPEARHRELAQVVSCAHQAGRSLVFSQNASEFITALRFETFRRAEELVGARADADVLLRMLAESEAELRTFATLGQGYGEVV